MSELAPRSSRPVLVHRVRAREPWLLATAAFAGIPAVAAAALIATNPELALLILFGGFSWLGAIFVFGLLALWKRSTRVDADKTERTARSSSKGLFVDGGPSIPREMIRSAFVSPSHPSDAYVRVHRRGGFPVDLWTADVEGAHALVSGLGLDESRAISVVHGAPPITNTALRLLFAVATIVVAANAVHLTVARLALLPLVVLFFALCVAPRSFVVGADGVLVRWLGRRRDFIPIGDIRDVEVLPGKVIVWLDGARSRQLVVAQRVGDQAANVGMKVGQLAQRIRGAMRRAGSLHVDGSTLERGERDVGSWISSLRELARGSGYRAAVQREDLVFLVEDARTTPAVRVAAAVALVDADAHERARLRIAAESSSIPEVREALEAVLEGDDERLSRTLLRVE